jgi:GT2 family glycosyltransferase
MMTQTIQPAVSRGSFERGAPWVRPGRLLIVIVAYRAVELTIDCLASLEPEIEANPGVGVIVCENGTGGDAAARIERAIAERGWAGWVDLWEATPNRGFAGGNNVVLDDVLTWADPPEHVLLLNADTIVRPGAIGLLLDAANDRPSVEIFAPRLEEPDGTPQVSCFRAFRPLSEFVISTRLGAVARLLPGYVIPGGPAEEGSPTAWVSFAAVMIRFSLLRRIGPLDGGYFLYFDDADYCESARKAGAGTAVVPGARVVHLQGQSNPLEQLKRARKRKPWYHFRSRSRYYAKHRGRLGLLAANLAWEAGFAVSLVLWLLFRRPLPVSEHEWIDIWGGFLNPLAPPRRGQDG